MTSSVESTGATHRGVLDTTILIHWPALDLAVLPDATAITTVTVAELATAVYSANAADERARRLELLQRVESAFDPLPFDIAAARAYGSVVAAVRQSGHSPRDRKTRRRTRLLRHRQRRARRVPLAPRRQRPRHPPVAGEITRVAHLVGLTGHAPLSGSH